MSAAAAPKPPKWLGLALDISAVVGMSVLFKLAVHALWKATH